MRKFLTGVTITGADNWTNQDDMVKISEEFPFVEWGILLSKSHEGHKNRYPSVDWVNRLKGLPIKCAGHLCGSWCRDFADGGVEFIGERGQWVCSDPLFQRLQLNVGGKVEEPALLAHSAKRISSKIIIQVRHAIPLWCVHYDYQYLFDCSGGQGISPELWPSPLYWESGHLDGKLILTDACGYAGGLSPENLQNQIVLIDHATHGWPAHSIKPATTWIDMESGVRTDDVLAMEKVKRVLSIAQPYVV
jgi:hypothetical protein